MDNHNKAGSDQLSAALRLSPTRNAEAYLLPPSSQSLLVIGFPSMQIHHHSSARAAPARTKRSLLPGTKACTAVRSPLQRHPFHGCIQIMLNCFKAIEELLDSHEPFSPKDIPPTPWFGSSTKTFLLLLTALMRQQFPAGVMESPTSSKQAVGPSDTYSCRGEFLSTGCPKVNPLLFSPAKSCRCHSSPSSHSATLQFACRHR